MLQIKKKRAKPLAETLCRQRRGVLASRDCEVGWVPMSMWPRIQRRMQLRSYPKVLSCRFWTF